MPIMGFLRIPNLTTIKKIIELNASSYNVIAEEYSKRHFKQPKFEKPLEFFIGELPKKAKILDVGCGPGGESNFFVQNGFDGVGIDISDSILQIAKKNVPNAEFMNMNLLNLEFKENEFDGIWCCRTLIHIPKKETENALDGMKKVLKPGGILCACIVSSGDSKEYITNSTYTPSDKTGTVKLFFREYGDGELEGELKEAGFKILKIMKIQIERENHTFVFAKK